MANVEVDNLSKFALIGIPEPKSAEPKIFIEYLPKKRKPKEAHEVFGIQIGPIITC